MLIAAQKH